MKYLPVLLFVLAASTPFAASAATFPPACAVLTKTSDGAFWPMINNKLYLIARAGEPITIIWGSANANMAVNGQGQSIGFTGQQVVVPTGTTAYSYTFSAGAAQTTCTVTAVVLQGGSTMPQGSTAANAGNSGASDASPTLSDKNDAEDIGTTIPSNASFSVSEIPLLSGGFAAPGALVPVQYLKLVNISNATTTLPGVWVKQDGTAPEPNVIGFTTVDDKQLLHGSTGGAEGSTPFKDGLAFIPLNATFAPGQFRIFTIKAQLSKDIAAAYGKNLMIDVAKIDTTGAVAGTFPVRGTTWTLRAF